MREYMIEAAAEATDELMEKYLEGGELTKKKLSRYSSRTLANEIIPVLGGSAFKNKGVQAMLDAVIEYMPSPTEVKAIEGTLDDKDETPLRARLMMKRPFLPWHLKLPPTPLWVR